MHFTLHITNKCNLKCKYCYVQQGTQTMARETAFAAVDLAAKSADKCRLVFFGGEPLAERSLIYDVVNYSKEVKAKTGKVFYYKITTNGTLLDEEFLKFTRSVNMLVGFSHDGLSQDDCRVFHDGTGTFDILEQKIPLLLKYQPYAVAMCTVNPPSVSRMASSVEWLFNKGFRYIALTLNYDKSAQWDMKSMNILEAEYKKLAQLYLKWTKSGEKFYLSPFEMKIMSHLRGSDYCRDRCQLGRKQISVAPDGKLYPCVQFIGDEEFEMGNAFTGINDSRRNEIECKGSDEPLSCAECAIKARCNYTCGCLNRQATGTIMQVSPVQCRHEQILLPIADTIAEKLYKERNALFVHKHYNEFYPVISLIEDKKRG